MEHARPFAVDGSDTHVEAWSLVRLPFEPKGWLREYRRDLRTVLRSMREGQAGVLYAEYATPDQSFADLENVLLYNLGSGCFTHLAHQGLICRRVASRDDLHHVRYTSIEPQDVPPLGGQLLASARLVDLPPGSTPAHWWSAFRQQLKVHEEIGTHSPSSYRHFLSVRISCARTSNVHPTATRAFARNRDPGPRVTA